MTAPSSPTTSPLNPPSFPPLSPVPPPVPVETHPNRGALKRPERPESSEPSEPDRITSGSGFLTPEDAYKTSSPPRLRPLAAVKSSGVSSLNGTLHSSQAALAAAAALRPAVASLRPAPAIPISARLEQNKKKRSASGKRRQPGGWKKLLWIRQPCMLFIMSAIPGTNHR
jgi:phosphatidylinositol N-acetylglucosaminyltransferase subunit C